MNRYQITYSGSLHTECVHEESGARLQTDAPKDNHGKGEAFSPTDLLALALGSCVLTIMGIAAQNCGFDLEGATASVEKEMSKTPPRRISRIKVHVTCPTRPDEETRLKLEKAALSCPVHHSLHPEVEQVITFAWSR
jgi:putative redox protein